MELDWVAFGYGGGVLITDWPEGSMQI